MASDDRTNKAGDTKTTGKEYVKRESGEQDMEHVPQENPGHTAPNGEDLENPEQKQKEPQPADENVGEKIKEANKEK